MLRGQGKVALKMTMTLGKGLTLNNVLFVPGIRKNMVSRWLPHAFRGKQSGCHFFSSSTLCFFTLCFVCTHDCLQMFNYSFSTKTRLKEVCNIIVTPS